MLPHFHQGKAYTKMNLQVWRVQKCIPLVGAETQLTCVGQQTTPSHEGGIWPRMETWVNWGGPIAMVPCLHQRYIYIQRKLRLSREQKCIALVSGGTPLPCAGRQTTPSYGGRYRAENGNLHKFWWTYRNGTVFAPKKYLYPKEAAGMERTEMYSTVRCRNPTYLCGPANYSLLWEVV